MASSKSGGMKSRSGGYLRWNTLREQESTQLMTNPAITMVVAPTAKSAARRPPRDRRHWIGNTPDESGTHFNAGGISDSHGNFLHSFLIHLSTNQMRLPWSRRSRKNRQSHFSRSNGIQAPNPRS